MTKMGGIKIFATLVVLLEALAAAQSGCANTAAIHRTSGNRQYHYSWRSHPDRTFNWSDGRRYCKSLCMDLVSMEDPDHWQVVKDAFQSDRPSLRFIWTSGRKCNFRGCEQQPHLQPTIENGWFWATTAKKAIPNPFSNVCEHCEWGPVGALGRRQPDNRQGIRDGKDEGCLAVLDNLYKDGLKWHDVACHHRKPVICQL